LIIKKFKLFTFLIFKFFIINIQYLTKIRKISLL
jgi:hypothetical protein